MVDHKRKELAEARQRARTSTRRRGYAPVHRGSRSSRGQLPRSGVTRDETKNRTKGGVTILGKVEQIEDGRIRVRASAKHGGQLMRLAVPQA